MQGGKCNFIIFANFLLCKCALFLEINNKKIIIILEKNDLLYCKNYLITLIWAFSLRCYFLAYAAIFYLSFFLYKCPPLVFFSDFLSAF